MWIIACIVLIGLSWPSWWKHYTIWRWRRKLALNKHCTTFERLFASMDGFALSRRARIGCDAMEYVYGEIEFVPFIALLSLVRPDINTIFYDLGSGTGKAVIACSLVFEVRKSCGIELFYELHHAALKQHRHLSHITQSLQPHHTNNAQRIHFIHDDFLQTDFSDATLIFINATGLFGPTWEALNKKLASMTSPLTVITTSKTLTSETFIVIKKTNVQMSWGIVNAYIHQRLPSST